MQDECRYCTLNCELIVATACVPGRGGVVGRHSLCKMACPAHQFDTPAAVEPGPSPQVADGVQSRQALRARSGSHCKRRGGEGIGYAQNAPMLRSTVAHRFPLPRRLPDAVPAVGISSIWIAAGRQPLVQVPVCVWYIYSRWAVRNEMDETSEEGGMDS
jgi:hypothetical protein